MNTSCENCQSAASAHDRGHGCTQAQPAHSAQPHFELQAVRRLAEAFARCSDARRGAAFPTAPRRERSEHLQPQPDYDRGAVLFRVTLRRHDLAAEVWHIKEPQKLPPVLSPEEVKR